MPACVGPVPRAGQAGCSSWVRAALTARAMPKSVTTGVPEERSARLRLDVAVHHAVPVRVGERPHERVYVAWDNSGTHQDDEVEAVVRGAAGRLVLLYLPTYSPWLNPIEMRWRQFRREASHCELFANVEALLDATRDCFARYNQRAGGCASSLARTPHDW
jgi:putative transposase